MAALLRFLWRSIVSIIVLAIMWVTYIVIHVAWPGRGTTGTAVLLGGLLVEAICIRILIGRWRSRRDDSTPAFVAPDGPVAGEATSSALPAAGYADFDEDAFRKWLADQRLDRTNLPPERLFGLRQAFLAG